jgi:GT2 family glycosyltransferase
VDVSVVIVSWNTRDLLRDCLRSIFQETRSTSFEVIVVDNASRDSTAEMIVTEFPTVKLIENRDNRGFAAANNQGIRESAGRYVLLLNPDTVVLDRAINRCIGFADLHPDVGVVGCQVLLDETNIQKTGFAFPTVWNLSLALSGLSRMFSKAKFMRTADMGWWGRDDERDLDVISGMFMLIRREALNEVGLLDEAYFVFAEETDLCLRLARAGWRRVFTPSCRIIHVCGGNKSTDQVHAKMFVQLQKSTLIFFRKNRGATSAAAVKALYVASNFARAVGWYGQSVLKRDVGRRSKAAAALAALRYHVLGTEPQ